MTAELDSAAAFTVSLAATYLIHSTIFLFGAWAADRLARRSAEWSERVWKAAAFAALLTAPLQVAGFIPGCRWQLAIRATASGASNSASASLERHAAAPQSEIIADRRPFRELPEAASEAATTPLERAAADRAKGRNAGRKAGQNEGPTVIAAAAPAEQRVDPGGAGGPSYASRRPTLATPGRISNGAQNGTSNWTSNWKPAASRWGLRCLAAGILGVGLLGLIRVAAMSLHLQSKLRGAESLSDARRAWLDDLCRRRRIRHSVRLLVSDDFPQPAACGLLRWTIVLPRPLATAARPTCAALLAHELAHLARRDPWWVLADQLLCHCLALQPLNRLARRRWQEAAEFLCDDWSASDPRQRIALADALTRVAEGASRAASRSLGPAISCAVAEPAMLTRRVERLLSKSAGRRRSNSRAWVCNATCCLIFGLLSTQAPGLTLPSASNRISPPQQQQQQKQPKQALDIELDGLTGDLMELEALLASARSGSPDRRATAEFSRAAIQLRGRARRLRATVSEIENKRQAFKPVSVPPTSKE